MDISDDMMTVLDGLRWAKVAIGEMVLQGDRRIQDVLTNWGMFGPNQAGQFIAARG